MARARLVVLIVLALSLSAPPAQAGFAPLPDSQFYSLRNEAESKTSDNPVALASADVNGDGRLDLVTPANEVDDASGKLHVFLGDGSGRFAQAAGSPFGAQPAGASIALGDLNDDGRPDAVIAHDITVPDAVSDGVAGVYIGLGGGAFASVPSPGTGGDSAVGIVLGQFTGSPRLDIAVANRRNDAGVLAGSVTVLEGNGPGTFAAPGDLYPLGAGNDPRSLVAADFNLDGRQDLATANDAGTVSVLRQDGAGGFAEVPFSPFAAGAGSLRGLAVANIDLFQGPDLVAASATSPGALASLRTASSGGLSPELPVPTGGNNSRGVVADDLTADGRVDVAVTNNQNPGQVAVLAGTQSATFAPVAGSPFPTSIVELPAGIVTGDFDGDSQPDLATVHSENAARMVVLINDDTPNATLSPSELDFGARAIGVPAELTTQFDNAGPGLLRTEAVTIEGPDAANFEIVDSACSNPQLTVGDGCPVVVGFRAGRLGPAGATLRVIHNGAGGSSTVALAGSGRRPIVSGVRATPRRFRVGRRATPVDAARRGTRFGFRLAEAGTVRLRIQRARPGRRVRGRCLRVRPGRRGRRCTRWVSTGIVLKRVGAAGPNRVRFSGRTRLRRLRPGPYRVLVVARDGLGKASRARGARFRVLRR